MRPDASLSQLDNRQLLTQLEAHLLELRRRIDRYLELDPNDVIAVDEGFGFIGQVGPTLKELATHAEDVGERLLALVQSRE